ncbi:MAG: hypothetical protein MK005_15785 [Alcanivorax sp.]|nr:hypothetical protein [Alcanivorax sp.]
MHKYNIFADNDAHRLEANVVPLLPRNFPLNLKLSSRIGLMMLCPLVLVNCDCAYRPPAIHLSCQASACSMEDDRCTIDMEFVAHNTINLDNELVSVLPMGKDAYIDYRTVTRGQGENDYPHRVYRYTYAFNPADAVDGVMGYAATVRSKSDGSQQTCADEIQVKGAGDFLTVALESPELVLDTESGSVPLPEYMVGGTNTAPVDAVWSANGPDWEIIEGESDPPRLNYAGTALEASSPRAATLTVSTAGPYGVTVSESVALSARYVYSALTLSQSYALPGDEISATYSSGAGGEEQDGTAIWTLLLTGENGQASDRTSALRTTATPNERVFTADEVGRYTIKRTEAADGDTVTETALSDAITVLEPLLNIIVSPGAEDINRGEPVRFDASGSTVPPGAEIGWRVTARPEGSSAWMEYLDTVGKQATLTPDVMEGSYTVEAQLSIPSLMEPLTRSRTFTFVSTPVAGPATDETDYLVGEEVSFDLTASDYPSGSSFRYTLSGAPEGSSAELLLSSDGTRASLLTDVAGVYQIELTITNAEGETSSHTTSITAEESNAVALTLASDLPVVDDDGDIQMILIGIDEDNRLTARAGEQVLGPYTALFLQGYWESEDTANLYDSAGERFEMVNEESGVLLDENVEHIIQLRRDDGIYFQVRLRFEAGDLEGDATVTSLSGYNCGESLSHCP